MVTFERLNSVFKQLSAAARFAMGGGGRSAGRSPIAWKLLLALIATAILPALAVRADDFELPPIEYSKSTPGNPVSQLQQALEAGTIELEYDERFGYLRSLLAALGIPEDSQMLVYSKTSLQRHRISPRTPRAIYFNDDVYIGYCQKGEMIEISVADPKLGAVFYTLEQKPPAPPAVTRQTQRCLQCHGTTQSTELPAHLARSVFTGASGLPILSEGSHSVDHTTPIENRWGGWYVTGEHGEQTHLGNLIVRDRKAKRPFDNSEGQNVTELAGKISADQYLTPHSDIVALMVFEHQLHVHNLITRASFETRRALAYEADLNRALGEPESNRLESTTRRIASAGEKLVEGLLFVGEPRLTAPMSGTSSFSETFPQGGPHDPEGRSLRQLDLQTRLFRYPCSYLVYSQAFDALPEEMKEYVWRRLWEILAAEDASEAYSHLSEEDRRTIRNILRYTKSDLPSYWLNG